MNQIQQITSDSFQTQSIILTDGTLLTVSLNYIPQQYGWFIQKLTYGSTFTITNVRVCVSPNMLQQWRNQIPFGIGCYYTTANREPTQQQDFASNLFRLYVLNADDVKAFQDFLDGTASS